MATAMFSCPEHDEKLKLFCATDQQLICVICRDGEDHHGHEFKPLKEAAMHKKEELKEALRLLSQDSSALDLLTKRQGGEVQKTEVKSKGLMDRMGAQFEEMHQFLRREEEKLMKDQAVKKKSILGLMRANQEVIERRLSDRREMVAIMQSALDIAEPEGFMQWWSEEGHLGVEVVKMRTKAEESGPDHRNVVATITS